jgi:hypothetical protein
MSHTDTSIELVTMARGASYSTDVTKTDGMDLSGDALKSDNSLEVYRLPRHPRPHPYLKATG